MRGAGLVGLATLIQAMAGSCGGQAGPRPSNGDGAVVITGQLRQWHKITLTLNGPFADEANNRPNPFTDYRMTVTFAHESGAPAYIVPGYFAADGQAAESSASSGARWRAHLAPDKPGKWTYRVAFRAGRGVALENGESGAPLAPFDGRSGAFDVAATDKSGRDLRGRGRLEYVGRRYLRFAGSGEYFLKAGADAPETLLAYRDFDGTETRKAPLKSWQPHLQDWRAGDPTWKQKRGRGLIGALNYLAAKGCNSVSFLTYNAGGDGDNVWPFIARDDKLHYDCSKLDQWQIVFDHAQSLGLHLHFKLQEQENDDDRTDESGQRHHVAAALDGGDLGPERKLYCRELVARFGHELALNWNLGEENTQSAQQQRAMAQYLRDIDPYHHPIVVHSFPDAQERVYSPLLGNQSVLTGASLQNGWDEAHQRTWHWIVMSEHAGRPWVVANDEQNPASDGVPPDPGYAGRDGWAEQHGRRYNLHDIRKLCLWGTLMAGGGGVEYYFGYQQPQNDLDCQDFRSRDRSWDYCRIALEFFRAQAIPFWEMQNADPLVGNAGHDNSRFCLARPGVVYLVYLPNGGESFLDLAATDGTFRLQWFDPRRGGALQAGPIAQVSGGKRVSLGPPPHDAQEDWLAILRRATH